VKLPAQPSWDDLWNRTRALEQAIQRYGAGELSREELLRLVQFDPTSQHSDARVPQ
jgi:hypothetical protein